LFPFQTIDHIKDTVTQMQKEQKEIHEENRRQGGHRPGGGSGFQVNKTFASIARTDLDFAAQPPSKAELRMCEVYEAVPFDNPDGGAWKQGWDVRYDPKEASDPNHKLNVFIMPHTHCDPGESLTTLVSFLKVAFLYVFFLKKTFLSLNLFFMDQN